MDAAYKLTIESTRTLFSGHKIPLLGLGVWLNASPVEACLAAFDAGYRHIDSAIAYRNEEGVGEAVRQTTVRREELFITTKVSNRTPGYDATLKAIDESLSRFKLDYVDLILIHDPFPEKELRLEAWRALIKARDDGKVKNIGVSNYGVKHLEEIKETGFEAPSVNQIMMHPWLQQGPTARYCAEKNILIEAYSPITHGHSLGDPLVQSLAKKYNKDAAQVLIRWSLQKGFSPLPKSSQPARVLSNSQVYDFELDQAEMDKLDAVEDVKDETWMQWRVDNDPPSCLFVTQHMDRNHSTQLSKCLFTQAWKAAADDIHMGIRVDVVRGKDISGVEHLEEIKEAGLEPPSVNQIMIHPWIQQGPTAQYCAENNILIEAYSPITQGNSLDHPLLQSLGKKCNKDAAQILIRWSLQKGFAPLPKSSQPARVRPNSQVHGFDLVQDEMGKLEGLEDMNDETWKDWRVDE